MILNFLLVLLLLLVSVILLAFLHTSNRILFIKMVKSKYILLKYLFNFWAAYYIVSNIGDLVMKKLTYFLILDSIFSIFCSTFLIIIINFDYIFCKTVSYIQGRFVFTKNLEISLIDEDKSIIRLINRKTNTENNVMELSINYVNIEKLLVILS